MAQNAFLNFLALTDVFEDADLYEVRMENDTLGNILYVGKSITPNASESDNIWFIKKLTYDGNGFVNYIQLPINGGGFLYSWTDRATYF